MSLSSESTIEPLKVLIADDDAPTRILLKTAITAWGYQTIEAEDGEEAWRLLSQEKVARLLIIDWLMPKFDGVALCKKIRSELDFSPYIILLTQVTGITNLIKGLDAGANEFLSKPFNVGELKSRLSIGARIIRNENALAKQNRQSQQLMQEMKQHFAKINSVITELERTCKANGQHTDCLHHISQLTKHLHHMEKVLNNFDNETNVVS